MLSLLHFVLWAAFGSFTIYVAPSFYFGVPTWELYPDQRNTQTLFAVAHLLFGVLLIYRGTRKEADWLQFNLVLVYGSLLAIVLLCLFFFRILNPSRIVIILTLGLSILIHAVAWLGHFWVSERRQKLMAFLPLFLLALGLASMYRPPADLWSHANRTLQDIKPQIRKSKVLSSNFYNVQVDYFHNYLPHPVASGGGMTLYQEKIILVTGDGLIYCLQDRGLEGPEVRELAIQVPLNRQAFVDAVSEDVRDDWFRVAGICLDVDGDEIQLWVSHHHWDEAEQFVTVRISTIKGTLDQFSDPAANSSWRTFYETNPGLPLIKNPKSGISFVGMEIGGRIECLDDEHLIFSVGELGYDGWENEIAISQDPESPFGKLLVLNKDSGESEVFSSGHRNPQGLCVTEDGSIWSTEHGPRGGDELNLIRRGENYGWPFVTLGASYTDTVWPLSSSQGSHDGYTWPVYSWSPSIGVSNLIQIRGPAFPVWYGDFLVSSLYAGTVYRTMVMDGRVVESEPLNIGSRIRDIIETMSGVVYLWTDEGDLVRLSPVSASDRTGEIVFARCQVCHTRNLQGEFAIGPDLSGVLGRKIASAAGYEYSPALKKIRGSWSAESMDAFLKDPQSFARGSKMVMPGLDEADRNAILDYLKNY